jgi:uncharacterized Zn finger protein
MKKTQCKHENVTMQNYWVRCTDCGYVKSALDVDARFLGRLALVAKSHYQKKDNKIDATIPYRI